MTQPKEDPYIDGEKAWAQQQRRAEALAAASTLYGRIYAGRQMNQTVFDIVPEAVVEWAEKFEEYLKGSNDAPTDA